jgi:hypothetical protein
MPGISRLAENLLFSQEGLCSMEKYIAIGSDPTHIIFDFVKKQ